MSLHAQKQKVQAQYLSILQKNPHPFENATSRFDFMEKVDIQRPHQRVDRKLERHLRSIHQNHLPKLQPLLGRAGAGKTHYYWTLKERERKQEPSLEGHSYTWKIVYVPSPPMPVHIPLHILTCLVDEHGDWLIQETASNLWKKFQRDGAKTLEDIKIRAISYYGGVHSEILRVLIRYANPSTSQEIKNLSKRWLFADNLEPSELKQLQVKKNIEDDSTCFMLLRIFDEFNGNILLFYFDELELIYRMHGAQAEIRLWETIKKLFNETKNSLFITTCLLDVWERVQQNLDSSVISRFEIEIKLQPFKLIEAKELYKSLMTEFWDSFELPPLPNHYFPLNDHILEIIFQKSKGNPRQIIKLCGQLLEKIIDEEVDPTSAYDGMEENQIRIFLEKIHATTERAISVGQNIPIITFQQSNQTKVINNRLLPKFLQPHHKKARLIVSNEKYFVNINANSIISSFITFINKINEVQAKFQQPTINFETNTNYEIQGERKNLPLEFIQPEGKCGIQVPVGKKFQNFTKAQAYYLTLDCTKALTRGKFRKLLLILPTNLLEHKGSIPALLQDFEEDLLLLEVSETEIKHFIEATAPLKLDLLLKVPILRKSVKFLFPRYHILENLEKVIQEKTSSESKSEQEQEQVSPDEVKDLREFLFNINN